MKKGEARYASPFCLLEPVTLLLEGLQETYKMLVDRKAMPAISIHGVEGGNARLFVQPDSSVTSRNFRTHVYTPFFKRLGEGSDGVAKLLGD